MSAPRFDAEARQGLAMISPPLVYALLLLAAPLLTILAYSFFKDGYLEVIREFTLDNYRTALSDPVFHKVMLRSVVVAMLVTPSRPVGLRTRRHSVSRAGMVSSGKSSSVKLITTVSKE